MPKVSAKRQITIPIDQCQEMHIEPGDEIETFIHNGQITLVKKEQGAAKGILKDIPVNERISDEESLQSTLNERH
jgi:bifunctional DNA-binding transcriptional regulator/antitoxin component of YhaV-PrlF toxin-antitoxin module